MLTFVLAVLAGAAAGAVVAVVWIRQARSAWLLAGQRQAELCHGTWHPAVSGQEWNRPEVPQQKRRSPDHQLVARSVTPTRERPARTH